MQPVMTLNNLKQCRVCSDVALCFNFDGLCCEACKVFFRRSLVNKSNYTCRKKSICPIDKWNRNSCKKCRLDKCFEIGMKKQMIERFKEKLNLQTQIPPCVEENTNQLQEFDLKCIADIRNVTAVFTENISLEPIVGCNDLRIIVKLSAIYLQKTVKYCRQMEDFNSIIPRDQLTMLKSFFPESCLLYASYIFDIEEDGLPVAACDAGTETVFLKLELTNANLKKNNYYSNVFRNFAIPMKAAIENDCTVRDLLLAQSLFKPRIDIDCTEFVKYKQWFYRYLLWRYLKFKYQNQAQLKFAKLMRDLDELDRISGIVREFFVHEVDKNDAEQVLLELFNLL